MTSAPPTIKKHLLPAIAAIVGPDFGDRFDRRLAELSPANQPLAHIGADYALASASPELSGKILLLQESLLSWHRGHEDGKRWSIGAISRVTKLSRKDIRFALRSARRKSEPTRRKRKTLWYWSHPDGRSGGPCSSQASAWAEAGSREGEPVSISGARVTCRVN